MRRRCVHSFQKGRKVHYVLIKQRTPLPLNYMPGCPKQFSRVARFHSKAGLLPKGVTPITSPQKLLVADPKVPLYPACLGVREPRQEPLKPLGGLGLRIHGIPRGKSSAVYEASAERYPSRFGLKGFGGSWIVHLHSFAFFQEIFTARSPYFNIYFI